MANPRRATDPGSDEAPTETKREPFCDPEAESLVLAAVLDSVGLGMLDRVASWLRPEHFFFGRHGNIYRAALALNDAGSPVTAMAIKHWLDDRKLLGQEDLDLLVRLAAVPFDIQIEANARRMINKYTMERVARACERTLIEAAGYSGEAKDFALRFEGVASEISAERERRQHGIQIFSMHDLVESVAKRMVANEPPKRCTTGIPALDDDIGGLASATVTIMAADTNWGKTNIAIMIADENIRSGKRVLIVSYEDDEQIYGQRILARRANVNAARLRDHASDPEEFSRILGQASIATRDPLFVRAIGAPTEEVAARVARLCEAHGVDLVIVDYLQAARLRRRVDDRRSAIDEVIRTWTDVVKVARASGVFLSQIRRLSGTDTRPTKHDLKESGDLENSAENVILGYRKGGRYRLASDKVKNGIKGEYELEWDANACCFRGGRPAYG